MYPPEVILPLIGRDMDPPTFVFGYDVSRFGGDHNVFWLRHGSWIIAVGRWSSLDSYENAHVVAMIIKEMEEMGWICMWGCVDVIGVGGGVVDALWARGERFREIIKPINVAMRSTDPLRYRNVRSELCWQLRNMFRNHILFALSEQRFGSEMGIPNWILERLQRQATTIQYKSDERFSGVIQIQSKDEYKKLTEGQESPDEFDALTLAINDSHVGQERRPPRGGLGASLLAR